MDENLVDASHHFNEENIDSDPTSSSKLKTNEVSGSNFEGNGVEKDEEVAKGFRYRRRGFSEESVDTKLDRNSYGHGYGMKQNLGQGVEEMRRISGGSVDNWVNGNGRGMNLGVPQLIRETLGDNVGGIRSAEQERLLEFRRSTGGASRHGRLSGFPYYGEGTSNYHPGSLYGYWGAMDNGKRIDRLSRVQDLEQNRAELLRKLDELKDQINRSCDTVEKPKERVLVDRQMVQNGIYSHIPEDPSGLSGNSAAQYGFDKHAPLQHPHFNQGTRLVDMQGLTYLMRRMPEKIPAYEDPYRLHMCQRAPNQLPHHYFPQRVEESFPAGCGGFDQESVSSYSEPGFHGPSCSCLHCYNRNWEVPTKVPPTILANGRIPNAQINPSSVHLRNHGALGPLDHQYSGANSLPLHPHDPYPHIGRPDNFGPESAGFGQRLSGALYHPVSGGAPFITCVHCFQLLELPRKKIAIDNEQQNLRCGACSNVILLLVEKKRLTVSIPSEAKLFLSEVDEGGDEKMSECAKSSHGWSPAADLASLFADYGVSGDNFQLEERRSRSDLEERHALKPSSSRSPGKIESVDREILIRDGSNSDPLPLKDINPPGPHASLQELFDYSTAMRRVKKEDQSKSMDQEKAIPVKCTSQHSVATETEVSYNEYGSSNLSQDNSAEVSKGNDQKPNNKGNISIVGLIKKGYKEFSRSVQGLENEIANVTVNGQPIPDYVVKNAEKLAGPIRPGDYWYDYHAGFWGVMGHPCLGMIPPFIEEFNYPMPENCAGGRTGVFVNGRELHHKDLNLLASRGLPTTRHKSYFIEISGRVMDEDTDEELDYLGKLAPSVVRAQKGRGMRVPRAIA
ncbi:putative zinc-ribbon domain, plant [Dillenia turbinata]|uniref:Zinc-ribbon domain, plant n=1 Tax=Dillenia turbinata TaxID=194707 RepID=A0AAN8WGB4_9MAGN